VTNDAGQSDVLPPPKTAGSGPEAAPDSAPAPKSKPDNGRKPRPKTILELVEYAYAEGGRKLSLARKDLDEITVAPGSADAEMDSLRKSAGDDPFLAVPPSILLALAELGAQPPVRRRILELVLAALASHPVFAKLLERLVDSTAEPALAARDVSEAASRVTFDAVGLKNAAEFKAAARERSRVNAVTAFEMYRVLHDGWTIDRFVQDMASLVWDTPSYRDVAKAASVLASAKSTDALSQLSRHFERLLHEAEQHTGNARAEAMQQARRAEASESRRAELSAQLTAEKERARELAAEVADLNQRLAAEQSSRVVDKSHLVDDFEALRTQVIRRLSSQVELLSDGLHALRNGSTSVAEEFLDRSLTAIEGDVTRLKELDGGGQ
jgi:hypothetical protein